MKMPHPKQKDAIFFPDVLGSYSGEIEFFNLNRESYALDTVLNSALKFREEAEFGDFKTIFLKFVEGASSVQITVENSDNFEYKILLECFNKSENKFISGLSAVKKSENWIVEACHIEGVESSSEDFFKSLGNLKQLTLEEKEISEKLLNLN